MGGTSSLFQPGGYGVLGVPAPANLPGGRAYGTNWVDSSGNFWLFGGLGVDASGTLGDLNDLWEYNLLANEWTWMGGASVVGCSFCSVPGVYGTLGTPAASNAPGSRTDAAAWTDKSGNLWLFGGEDYAPNTGYVDLNDLWRYQPPVEPACSYSLSPSGAGFGPSGGANSFRVITGPTCPWRAEPTANWITLQSSASVGTGTVNYSVTTNTTTGASRDGSILVGGHAYNIDQGGLSCTFSLSQTSISIGYTGGNSSISVGTPNACSWTAKSNAPWLTVSSGASRSGPGKVVLNVAANTGTARSGTATIAGQTVTITQSAGAASACGALDVTPDVDVSMGVPQPIPFQTNQYSQNITITNNSGISINGPLSYVLVNLSPPGAGVFGNFPVTYCFSQAGSSIVLVSSTGLAARNHVKFSLTFFSSSSPNYTAKVISGTLTK